MTEIGFRVFFDWKQAFLKRRGLQSADGRALHLYSQSDAEFDEMEQLLKDRIPVLLYFHRLGDLHQLTGFSALFVLFAAEWWRRRFDGGHWSWAPILLSVGADPDSWSQAQRSQCVQLGLSDWGLKPRSSGGLRFLGSIAVQGGLPLRLLAESRDGIGRLLGQVLKHADGSGVTQPDVQAWVESLQLIGGEVIYCQLPLRRAVLRLADVPRGQVLTLLVGLVPGLEGVLRRIAELADGQAGALAQLDVELNSSQSVVV